MQRAEDLAGRLKGELERYVFAEDERRIEEIVLEPESWTGRFLAPLLPAVAATSTA